MRARVVVVGGGIAGLVAAIDLARAGLAPVLLEASSQLGGRAQTRILDGCHFNQGPHALYVAGALNTMLAEFGVEISGGRPDVAAGLGLWGLEAHPLPIGLPRDAPAAPLDREEAVALASQLRRIGRGHYDGRGQPLRSITATWPRGVQTVIEALVRLTSYVHAPHLIDAKAALDQLRLSFAGALYLDDGWASLVAGLANQARRAGADVRTESRVSAVLREETGWRVERLGAAPVACDTVILAVPPPEAVAVAASSKTLAAISSDLRPAQFMGLDLALSPGLRPRTSFALGMDAPTYLSVHSTAARLAPPDWVLAHLARYLAPGEPPTAAAMADLEHMADQLLPGWRSHETHRQRLLGHTVTHAIPGWQDGGRRADCRVADSAGLFLAGDWIGEHGMLADAAAASARVAAAEALTFLAAVPAS